MVDTENSPERNSRFLLSQDVHHFQLYGPNSPWYHTRLRPNTRHFLSEWATCTNCISAVLERGSMRTLSHHCWTRMESCSHTGYSLETSALIQHQRLRISSKLEIVVSDIIWMNIIIARRNWSSTDWNTRYCTVLLSYFVVIAHRRL